MLKVNKMGESRSILVQAVINLLLTCIVALPGIDSITLFTCKFEKAYLLPVNKNDILVYKTNITILVPKVLSSNEDHSNPDGGEKFTSFVCEL